MQEQLFVQGHGLEIGLCEMFNPMNSLDDTAAARCRLAPAQTAEGEIFGFWLGMTLLGVA